MKVNFGFCDLSDLRLKLIENVRPTSSPYREPVRVIDQVKWRHSHDDFDPITQPIFDYLADWPNTRSRRGTTPSPVHHPYGAPASR
jgi:hypothetical protein